MKSTLATLFASFALAAAAAMTGCQTNGSLSTEGAACTMEKGACTDKSSCCSDKGACTDKSSCGDKGACSGGEKKASGCCSGEAKPANKGAMNTTCPFSGKAVNASLTTNYNGQAVAFCCAGCKGKFDNASDTDRAALVAKVKG